MKKIVILLTILLSIQLHSNIAHSAFGIKVGSDFSQIPNILKQKGLKYEIQSPTFIFVRTEMFNRECQVGFTGYKGKLIGILVNLTTTTLNYISTFNEVFNVMKDKYGVSTGEKREYDYPYEPQDGHTITGIRLGKIKILNWWINDVYKTILIIRTDLDVSIIYTHEKLWNDYQEDQKKKNSSNL